MSFDTKFIYVKIDTTDPGKTVHHAPGVLYTPGGFSFYVAIVVHLFKIQAGF